MSESEEKRSLIIVCDNCLRASCWQGLYYCEAAKVSGTKKMPTYELLKLDLEHPDYWQNDRRQRR